MGVRPLLLEAFQSPTVGKTNPCSGKLRLYSPPEALLEPLTEAIDTAQVVAIGSSEQLWAGYLFSVRE